MSLTDGVATEWDHKTAPDFIREIFRIPPGVTLKLGQGASFIAEQRWPDSYVYCLADRFGEDLLREFGGACVRIDQPAGFFELVTHRLRQTDRNGVARATRCALGSCDYREREQTWPRTTPYHPAFRKPLRYSYQNEVRAVWDAPCQVLEPVNLTLPALAALCTRIR